VQGRPHLVTPEAREGVLDFLLENGKLTYINEVKFYLKDEWGIEVLIIRLRKGSGRVGPNRVRVLGEAEPVGSG
jgi:hypothetical protein